MRVLWFRGEQEKKDGRRPQCILNFTWGYSYPINFDLLVVVLFPPKGSRDEDNLSSFLGSILVLILIV